MANTRGGGGGGGGGGVRGLFRGASLPVPVCEILIVVEVSQELSKVHISPLFHRVLSPRSLDAQRIILPYVVEPGERFVVSRWCQVRGGAPRTTRQEDAVLCGIM
jgi:hypothetical protein